MNWIKARICNKNNLQLNSSFDADLITVMLMDIGINNIEIIDKPSALEFLSTERQSWDYIEESFVENMDDLVSIVFYIEDNEEGHDLLNNIKARLDEGFILTNESVNDESWLNEWKKHFQPINIKNITIVPEWIDYSPKEDEIIFILSHCSAFGTGQHASTQLCIEGLQKYIKKHDKVFDIGCGSGILSIISLLLDAKNVLAIDIDSVSAITATNENAKINNIDPNSLTVKSVNILTDYEFQKSLECFDIIVANIVSDVIIELAKIVPQFLKHGGIFISSGIIIERADEVSDALKNNGLNIIEKTDLDGWCSLVCKYDILR